MSHTCSKWQASIDDQRSEAIPTGVQAQDEQAIAKYHDKRDSRTSKVYERLVP